MLCYEAGEKRVSPDLIGDIAMGDCYRDYIASQEKRKGRRVPVQTVEDRERSREEIARKRRAAYFAKKTAFTKEAGQRRLDAK